MMPAKTRVALIDDHVLFREGLVRIIVGFEHFEVINESTNGNDYAEQMKSIEAPDIVVLDISMPQMNGFETLDWIRRHQPDTRMLILSMLESETAVVQLLKAGAHGFLSKDAEPDELRQCLEDIRDKGYAIHGHKILLPKQKGTLLTSKEREFISLACTELTYREIAEKLNMSARSVDGYRDQLFTKLNVTSRVGLVLYAVRNGIVMLQGL